MKKQGREKTENKEGKGKEEEGGGEEKGGREVKSMKQTLLSLSPSDKIHSLLKL